MLKKIFRTLIKRGDDTHIIKSDDERKIKTTALSIRGIGSHLSEQDRDAFAALKELQKEFQRKYCPTCIHYDMQNNQFLEKGNSADEEDCRYHFTDFLGNCWNFKERKN
jgi:hypothetical protein